MVKYLIAVSMLVLITCTGGMRIGIGDSGSGTTNISLEDQLALLEWAVDDAVFTLEREHGDWDHYSISATFSDKSYMSDYTWSEAMDTYIELTNIWINSCIQERCQLIVNWQRM